jgi:hypothetical protein
VATTDVPLARDFKRGELDRLLPDWYLDWIEAHALFASGQPRAARAFIEHLIEAVRKL